MRNADKLKPLRCAVLFVLFAAVAPALTVAAMAAGASLLTAGLVATLVTAVALYAIVGFLPTALRDSSRAGRALFVCWFCLGLFGAYRVASLGVFMYDVTRTDHAFNPTIRKLDDPDWAKPFFPKHNCFTCYIVGAHVAGEGVENIYDARYYRRAEVRTPIHEQIGDSLHVDSFQYPPPFLILPRLLMATGGDFYQLRSFWFALNVVTIVAVVSALILWIGGRSFNVYWLALPVLMSSPIMLGSLQIQNAHIVLILMALTALVFFAKGRPRLGGALLAFPVVSKLFPGLLLVFLILQRRWRAALWTGTWMVTYCLAALLLFGLQPFKAFLGYQMPRLMSGEAFWFAKTYIAAIIKNGSVMGAAYKFEKLGLLSDPDMPARALVWIYTGLLLVVLLVVGTRKYCWSDGVRDDNPPTKRRLALAAVWLVLLILGQLRSPFLPWGYGNVPVVLLFTLLIPTGVSVRRFIWITSQLFLGWVTFAVTLPLPIGPPSITPDLIHTLATLGVTLMWCGTAILIGLPRIKKRRAGAAGTSPPVRLEPARDHGLP